MARGPNQKGSANTRSDGQGAQNELPPTFKIWFEEAWHGWLKPVGGIVLVIGLYFAYESRQALGLSERLFGMVAVAAIVVGAIFSAAEPAFERLQTARSKYLLGAFLVAWGAAAAYPPLRTAIPTKVLGEAHIAADKDHLSASVKLPDGENGPYEVEVGGNLKGQGEAESNYTLSFNGEGGSTEEIQGKIQRTFMRQRVSRKGTGTVAVRQEHNENAHRLAQVRGPALTVTADGADDTLEDGLFITVHKAGPNPALFLGLGVLCLLVGIFLDYQLLVPKKPRTHFATATGFTLVFALYFPMEATPHRLVPPAVAALLLALVTGALGAWLLSVIVNGFKPKPKKMAGAKA